MKIKFVGEFESFLLSILGHDTTASAVSWVLWSLAKHPEMQEKIRKEVEFVLNGKIEPDS